MWISDQEFKTSSERTDSTFVLTIIVNLPSQQALNVESTLNQR